MHPMQLAFDTSIHNLWLTGQDTFMFGIFPAAMSGFFTASAVLGYTLCDMVLGRTLAGDIAWMEQRKHKAS